LNSSVFGGAVFLSPFVGCSPVSRKGDDKEEKILEKVKTAMLSMQRASWEQGVAAQAFLEAGDDTMTCLMAREALLRQTNEGRLSVLYWDNGVTDPAASGQAVLHAYNTSGDPSLKEAYEKMLEYLLEKAPRSPDGILHHTLNAPEIWADSFYMAPPFLAAAGQFQESMKQINGMRNVLWNNEKKLFSHRWDTNKEAFVDARFWGGGNGWAAAGMARVIKVLPEDYKEQKDQLAEYVRLLLNGCLETMRADGLFHNFLDEPASFVETNLSQMLAYTIFSGAQQSWLDPSYIEPALKMREAAWKKVDEHGYVQDVCGAPFFDKPGRSTEAQAFFLLMETAHEKWSNSK
jgi:unsaturated rhamnogalacturonyl hydrolase